MTTDVLIFVEDPGAANFVAQLPQELAQRECRCILLAEDMAALHLHSRQVSFQPVKRPTSAKAVLEDLRPRLLVVGTSENADTFAHTLVLEARQLKIPSLGVVDSLTNSTHRFRGRAATPLAYVPDGLIVPDDATKSTYVELGYPADKVAVCGHPHLDYVCQVRDELALQDPTVVRRRVLPSQADLRKVVVFASENSNTLDPDQSRRSEQYTLTGRGNRAERTQIVLEEFLDAVALLDTRPFLVLRLHPKNMLEEFADDLESLDFVSVGTSSLELISVADLVVGMTSMMLLEAAVWGIPTLSIVPCPTEREWLPSVRMGATPCVATREELRAILPALIHKKSPDRRFDIPLGATRRLTETILTAWKTMRSDQKVEGGPLLRWAPPSDATLYSPWPRRLVRTEDWQRPDRDEAEILREFNDGWFRKCLDLWDSFSVGLNPSTAHPDAVLRFFYQVLKELSLEVERNSALYHSQPDSSLFSIDDQLLVGDLILGSMIHIDMIVRYVDKLLSQNPVPVIVEPGCGNGIILFHLYARLNINRIVGGDLCPNAVTLGNRISETLGIPGTFKLFDYKDRSSMRALTDGLEDYVLLTCHSIEQTPIALTDAIIDDILNLPSPPRAVIHFEPMVAEGEDTLMGELCREYAERNHYNTSLLGVVSRCERERRLAIVGYQKRFFGLNAFYATSMLSWRPLS